MSEPHRAAPRVLVAAVVQGKSRSLEALAKMAGDEVRGAGLSLVRSVMVNGERQYIQQLVSNVSNGNEADAIVILGGAGFGPRDDSCEAIDSFVERRIEGFGDAYRRLLEPEIGARALLVRATAGVYNQCVLFVMDGRDVDVQRALKRLVLPNLVEAVDLATGRKRAQPHA
jgi:molybdenum cofactor biosynthesis protein B